MNLIDRYVARTILSHTMLALALLLALGGLWLFLGQQDDIGVGEYQVAQALLFSLLNLPRQAIELLPIAALIGALFGLGSLARGSELVILRAAGISAIRVGLSAAMAGVAVVAGMVVLSEFVAPPLDRHARELKTFSKFARASLTAGSSAWIRDGRRFINVKQQSGDRLFGGVYIYELDASGRLLRMAHARTAQLGADQRWRLSEYAETRLGERRIEADRAGLAVLETGVSPEFLGLAADEPETLTVGALRRSIEHLRRNRLDAGVYETALWSRFARTTATLVMCVLAVPFAFGPMRAAGYGARTVIGVLIGVLYFLLTRTMENSAQVYDLSPAVVAWVPTLLLAGGTLVALARTR